MKNAQPPTKKMKKNKKGKVNYGFSIIMKHAQPPTKKMKMKKKGKVNYGFSVPQEIIREILKELPVKTLLRFRCVSKLWHSIIDDPLFVQSHHNLSIIRPDGINLLFNCIWNPSTRERRKVPRTTISSPKTIDIRVGHNPLKVISFNLLGFDPSSGKHKVLNISETICTPEECDDDFNDDGEEEIHTQFKVLTLSSHGGEASTWRDIDIDSSVNGTLPQERQLDQFFANRFFSPDRFAAAESACCINGTIYCLGSTFDDLNNLILAFEVGPESLKIMRFPQGATSDSCFAIDVRECLALINFELTKIWILEDYGKQLWNMQILYIPLFLKQAVPIATVRSTGGKILFQYDTSKFFDYDLESEKVKK
ncbi:putative F-box protein At1g20657 [Cornus florida]|uniref:putative F-box protein At1g20657 n=1 Tax=Cornus florida TaxID=4283 RepID=UPI0028A093EE|nr:putative F-box protein At1g20657 [Cornus florida]